MTAASKEESLQFAQIAKDLKRKLAKYANQSSSSFSVPIMGTGHETVKITKPRTVDSKDFKKGKHHESKLDLSFEDVVIFSTSKESSAAIYLGQGVDPASESLEHWFFSQSDSGSIGAIFFGGLKDKSQLSTPQYKIKKAQL